MTSWGTSHGRVVTQLFVEALVLAAGAAALEIAIAEVRLRHDHSARSLAHVSGRPTVRVAGVPAPAWYPTGHPVAPIGVHSNAPAVLGLVQTEAVAAAERFQEERDAAQWIGAARCRQILAASWRSMEIGGRKALKRSMTESGRRSGHSLLGGLDDRNMRFVVVNPEPIVAIIPSILQPISPLLEPRRNAILQGIPDS